MLVNMLDYIGQHSVHCLGRVAAVEWLIWIQVWCVKYLYTITVYARAIYCSPHPQKLKWNDKLSLVRTGNFPIARVTGTRV